MVCELYLNKGLIKKTSLGPFIPIYRKKKNRILPMNILSIIHFLM